ncbi:MAG: hypothetical protein ACR2JW_09480, partial [Thermomicrobiales bacterium]
EDAVEFLAHSEPPGDEDAATRCGTPTIPGNRNAVNLPCHTTRLRARATLNNPASRKVLEHNGFVAIGELTLNGKPAISYICELR